MLLGKQFVEQLSIVLLVPNNSFVFFLMERAHTATSEFILLAHSHLAWSRLLHPLPSHKTSVRYTTQYLPAAAATILSLSGPALKTNKKTSIHAFKRRIAAAAGADRSVSNK